MGSKRERRRRLLPWRRQDKADHYSTQDDPVRVTLREFLYVDTDKVRGLLAQLDGGIVEALHEAAEAQSEAGVGVKGWAHHSRIWTDGRTAQKSMGDALFPTLEHQLEAAGLLHDLTETLADRAIWESDEVRSTAPPGTLIRVTAEGSLFDARFVADTLNAYATTALGIADAVGATNSQASRSAAPKRRQRVETVSQKHQLEDDLPVTDLSFGSQEPVRYELLRGIVRVSRGLFAPGLHMNLTPTGDRSHAIVARLQEGRSFLDSEADVLFARYGVSPQTWTLVGTVGHHAVPEHRVAPDVNFVNADGNVARVDSASSVNAFMGHLGALGFVDLPQPPGFSVVPLAVYRLLGHHSDEAGTTDTL